jgi:hypothetical protein
VAASGILQHLDSVNTTSKHDGTYPFHGSGGGGWILTVDRDRDLTDRFDGSYLVRVLC